MSTYAVTGAGSGIGKATAELLRSRGHRVIGVDIRGTDITCDLGAPEGRAAAVSEIARECGGVLDGVVAAAGVGGTPGRPGAEVVSVNYFGAVRLLTDLRPLLARSGHASAVVISSNSTTAQPNWPVDLAEACLADDEEPAREQADKAGPGLAYPASKAALAWWVRQSAVTEAWAGSGIRLNAVAPGMVDTPMIEEGKRVPEIAEALKGFPIPIGRMGQAGEIAELIAFVLGPSGGFFCGSVIFADGGTDALFRTRDWPSVWTV